MERGGHPVEQCVWHSAVVDFGFIDSRIIWIKVLVWYGPSEDELDVMEVEYDRSSAGEEEYAVICERFEGSEKNGMRPIRLPCCTV